LQQGSEGGSHDSCGGMDLYLGYYLIPRLTGDNFFNDFILIRLLQRIIFE